MSFCFYYGDTAQRVHAGTLTMKACEGVNSSRDHVHVSESTAAKLIEAGRAVLRDGRLLETPEKAA
jgi:hypothetical protein